jgi:hypothetical protein
MPAADGFPRFDKALQTAEFLALVFACVFLLVFVSLSVSVLLFLFMSPGKIRSLWSIVTLRRSNTAGRSNTLGFKASHVLL